MKKLASLLTAALFALTAALPVSAAPADDSLAIVPAAAPAATGKHVKKVKAQKHKKVKKAKHKRARAHKRHY